MKFLGTFLSVLCIHSVKSTFYHSPPMIHQPGFYRGPPQYMLAPSIYVPPPQPYPLYVLIPKQVQSPCLDVHGRFVPIGVLYFDGIYWSICGKNLKVKPGYGILERKWQMVFRMLDINKDKIMSETDALRAIDLFSKHFGLKGKLVEPVKRSITLAWKMLFMNKPPRMTEKDFIQAMWSSYSLRRDLLFASIMKITDLLLFVTDNNKDGYVSFSEWNVLMQVLGIHDQRAAHLLFKFTVPNFWGYSTILGARQFIMNLILDQDPHYFFKYYEILQPAGLVSKPTVLVPSTGGIQMVKKKGDNGNGNGNSKAVVS